MPRKLSDTYSAIHQWIRRNFGNPDGVIIDKHLQEAHERGRKEGLEQGARIAEEYTFEQETLMSWYAGGQIASAIRTAMEGK